MLYIVLGGFRTNAQITTSPAGLPHPWVVSNYTGVLKSVTFWGEFANSTIVALVSTVGIVILGLMVSFVIARYDFKFKGAMYSLFAAGLMFPLVIAITPLYIVVKDLGLIDTLAGVDHPADRLRAADHRHHPGAVPAGHSEGDRGGRDASTARAGSGSSSAWCMPLSLPGVVTVGILAFIGSWNNYVLPLYILNTQANFTLPLGVQAFSSQYSQDTAKVLAFTSLAMLPALIFFSIFQKRIVGGLTGAVKG